MAHRQHVAFCVFVGVAWGLLVGTMVVDKVDGVVVETPQRGQPVAAEQALVHTESKASHDLIVPFTNPSDLTKEVLDDAILKIYRDNRTGGRRTDRNETATEQEMKYLGHFYPDHTPDLVLTSVETRLLHWVELHGLRAPCATIGHFPHPHFVNRTIRGIVANCSIPRDTAVMHIPTSIVVTPHRLRNSPPYERIYQYLKLEKKLSYDIDHLMLTIFIALERQDSASFWSPYIATLPTELFVPMESNDYGRLWYDASNVINQTKKREKVIHYQFKHLSEFFAMHPQLLPEGKHMNKAVFLGAYNAVTARSMRLDFGVHKDTPCLVPFADLMNHKPMIEMGWRFEGKAGLNTYVGYAIEHGQQVYNNYGDLGNGDLLFDYGFVSHDNPFTCAHLFLRSILMPERSADQKMDDETSRLDQMGNEEQGVTADENVDVERILIPSPSPSPLEGRIDFEADPYWPKRMSILRGHDVDVDTPMCIRIGPVSPLMMFVGLVLTANGDDLDDKVTVENLASLVTPESVPPAFDVIKKLTQMRLTDYAYGEELDVRLLPLLQHSANNGAPEAAAGAMRQYMAVFLRHQEKLILQSKLEFIESVSGYRCVLPENFINGDDEVPAKRVRRSCHRYANKVLLALMAETEWFAGRQYVKHDDLVGPYESWDFAQDHTKALPDW